MDIAELIAWAMFTVLIGWIGVVLFATFRTIDGEARAAERSRDRGRE